MSAGNLVLPLVKAVADILTASADVITLLGARSGVPYVVPFEDINDADDPTKEFLLPLYVYDLVSDTEVGPSIREREVVITLDAIAQGNGSLTTVTEMLAIARRELTWTAFNAEGLDAFVRHPIVHQIAPTDPEGTRGMVRHRLTLTLRATAP